LRRANGHAVVVPVVHAPQHFGPLSGAEPLGGQGRVAVLVINATQIVVGFEPATDQPVQQLALALAHVSSVRWALSVGLGRRLIMHCVALLPWSFPYKNWNCVRTI
jgi:hypothetical protein